MTKKPIFPTKEKALIGAAGVYAVASQLSLKGLIALPTIRNTAGVDLVVTSPDGFWHANLQVKTSRSKVNFWPVGTKFANWLGPNNFYVFLRFNEKEHQFEVFLETSAKVIENCTAEIQRGKEKGLKDWGGGCGCFYLRDDLERLRRKWEQFGPPSRPRRP